MEWISIAIIVLINVLLVKGIIKGSREFATNHKDNDWVFKSSFVPYISVLAGLAGGICASLYIWYFGLIFGLIIAAAATTSFINIALSQESITIKTISGEEKCYNWTDVKHVVVKRGKYAKLIIVTTEGKKEYNIGTIIGTKSLSSDIESLSFKRDFTHKDRGVLGIK